MRRPRVAKAAAAVDRQLKGRRRVEEQPDSRGGTTPSRPPRAADSYAWNGTVQGSLCAYGFQARLRPRAR